MIHIGDCREVMRTMDVESVQCVVTSPPYFGLRSYMPDAVQLRKDLTPEDREYVEKELARLGISPTSEMV